jgi:hypothetical protein
MDETHDSENLDATLERYEVVEMGCGDSALYMRYAFFKQGIPYSKHFLAFYKGGYQFFVNITMQGRNRGQAELDFLLENISLE